MLETLWLEFYRNQITSWRKRLWGRQAPLLKKLTYGAVSESTFIQTVAALLRIIIAGNSR